MSGENGQKQYWWRKRTKTRINVKNLKRKYCNIQKESKSLLNNGSVRVLVDFPVSPETTFVLRKGLGER